MVQRRGPMALSQDSKTPALLLSSSQELNSIMSWTNASQLGLAPSPSEYIRSPPFHPWGPLALLPQMWCWAYGAWLDAQRHHWFQALGPCREACACTHTHTHTHTHKWEQEASSGVHYTYHQPKKDEQQPQKWEAPHDSWNNSPLIRIDIAAATRLIVFFLEQCWKSLKRQ